MAHYEVRRSTGVAAPPAAVHALIEDFHQWSRWSPWEGLDPDMEKTFSGADHGVGSRYAWTGNRKAGEGSMEMSTVTPERIGVELAFVKPFRSTSHIDFDLVPSGAGTEVTWTMTGEQTGLTALVGKVVSMEKLVGKDFERGLANLKRAAEE